MGKLNKNESGFGATGVLLIIVIVALLGVVGWFVYDRNHNKTTSANTTTTTPTTNAPIATKTPESTTSVIKISSLSIKFTAPNTIKDLTFSTASTEGNESRVAVSTETLAKMDSACSVSKSGITGLTGGALGTIVRGTGKSPYPLAGDPNLLVKQYTSFYVAYEPPQMGYCATSSAVSNASKADISTLQTALKTVEAL